MLNKFFPDMVLDTYKDVTYQLLQNHRICALILDIDNTLVPYETKEPTPEVLNWIIELTQKGIKVCILSNAKQERVELFNKQLEIFAVHKASKPSTKGFIKATEQMNVQPYQTAVIGDQIFTDIYGGNKSGMFTILVKPITTTEIFAIKVKRLFEKFVLNRYNSLYPKGIKK